MILAQQYPPALVCRVLDYSRSSYYAQRQSAALLPETEAELRAAVLRLAARYPTYGYRRIQQHLRREQHRVNTKRVRRLMRLLQVQAKRPKRVVRTTNSAHGWPRYPNLVQGLPITTPDQVWVADISYIQLRQEVVYLAVILDVCTRQIRGWHLSRALDHTLTVAALRKALQQHRPQIHHSDQGVQYAAHAYVRVLQQAGVRISMAAVGEPTQNGYAERLIRTIKEEAVYLADYRDYDDAYAHLAQFIEEVYTHERIHSALGYLTPNEFEAQWYQQQQSSS